ncbi:hypothetical protein DSM112329_05317 [Paraconexibacter sp. AEG42_29]|uniref:Anti-sigma-28 factor FlgM C-terminal domain-containing protein n=1 Tax=Paraconexibacter sp. AEG42_29 TaxID=2997339 RepID=A0AAU7B3H1_9ACTN
MTMPSSTTAPARRERVRELRDRVQARDYEVDPQLVAAAVLLRLRVPVAGDEVSRAGARTRTGPP